MDYVNLGRSGLKVSRLCLGTMNFGPMTTEQDSFAIMDRAHEAGINFFDTADVYGWKTGGRSREPPWSSTLRGLARPAGRHLSRTRGPGPRSVRLVKAESSSLVVAEMGSSRLQPRREWPLSFRGWRFRLVRQRRGQ